MCRSRAASRAVLVRCETNRLQEENLARQTNHSRTSEQSAFAAASWSRISIHVLFWRLLREQHFFAPGCILNTACRQTRVLTHDSPQMSHAHTYAALSRLEHTRFSAQEFALLARSLKYRFPREQTAHSRRKIHSFFETVHLHFAPLKYSHLCSLRSSPYLTPPVRSPSASVHALLSQQAAHESLALPRAAFTHEPPRFSTCYICATRLSAVFG